MDNQNISLIKCRKCGGPHLTIKCGKSNEGLKLIEKVEKMNISYSKTDMKESISEKIELRCEKTETKYGGRNESKYGGRNEANYGRQEFKYEKTEFKYEKTAYIPKKIYKIKISNLPIDITQYEILDLLKNWGHITNVNIKNYNDSSIAVLEFKFEDEMEYFINALDSTPFEHQIISIIKLTNSY
jgi:hypothetical protein